MPMDWFKVYVDIAHDRKLRRLPASYRWLWIVILALARRSPCPGYLLLSEFVPVTLEDLADEAAITLDEADIALQAFERQSMVHSEEGVWVVTNFIKRQYDKPSNAPEQIRNRVQKHRETRCNADVTPMKRANNATEADSDSDTESEKRQPRAPAHEAAPPPDYVSTLVSEGWTEEEIAEARWAVENRDSPPVSVTNWARYLRPVLKDMRNGNGAPKLSKAEEDCRARILGRRKK